MSKYRKKDKIQNNCVGEKLVVVLIEEKMIEIRL